MALNMGNAGVNAEASGLNTAAANGYLAIYSGSKPATADTALSGNTLLAELTLPASPFSTVNGVMTAAAITPVSAGNTGTASFYRVYESDGSTCLWQGDVGAEMTLNSSAISSGAQVSVTSWTHTIPK